MNTYFCAAAVLALSIPAVRAQVLPFQVDHFKCYLPSNATDGHPCAGSIVGPVWRGKYHRRKHLSFL